MLDETVIERFVKINDLTQYPEWKEYKGHIKAMYGDALKRCGRATKDTIDECRGRLDALDTVLRLEHLIRATLDKGKEKQNNDSTK